MKNTNFLKRTHPGYHQILQQLLGLKLRSIMEIIKKERKKKKDGEGNRDKKKK
jgi:hypothetical protein